MNSRPKKSPTSPARRKPERGCGRSTSRSASKHGDASVPALTNPPAAAGRADTAAVRRKIRACQASLPTPLERDTLLTPEWVAESVVQEAERFLKAALPEDFAPRLAAKAYYLYPRHAHFHKMLNRPGNQGRDNLSMFMRHWTAGWLKREHGALHKKLPRDFAQGRPLPRTAA